MSENHFTVKWSMDCASSGRFGIEECEITAEMDDVDLIDYLQRMVDEVVSDHAVGFPDNEDQFMEWAKAVRDKKRSEQDA